MIHVPYAWMAQPLYSVSQKSPLMFSDIFFRNGGIFSPHFTRLSILDYKFLFSYLQL